MLRLLKPLIQKKRLKKTTLRLNSEIYKREIILGKNELYFCRICGLREEQPPWGKDGKTPSFEICSCCGAEFGYNDATQVAIAHFRKNWLDTGAKWFDYSKKSGNWSLEEQLKQIPYLFR